MSGRPDEYVDLFFSYLSSFHFVPLSPPQLRTNPPQVPFHRLRVIQIRRGNLNHINSLLLKTLADHAIHLMPIRVPMDALGKPIQVDGKRNFTRQDSVEQLGNRCSEGLPQP